MAKRKPTKSSASDLPFDPRQLMEKAIEAMQQTVSEPRKDGKASPAVGAVIYKPDGQIETACRGELRHGDHAEFTLLERKNRDVRLDDSALFATLEPCAPGSRRHPKISCAERIVLARIKRVWIGLEDPDPTVDRKGIKYLQDNGVEVAMFDRDLQEVIKKVNKEFYNQALERKAAAEEKKKPKKITLSQFEHPISTLTREDFSTKVLKKYRTLAKIEDDIDSESFRERLHRQGLLERDGDQYKATGFGFLLFGKEPRSVMPQAGLLGTIHYPNGKQETKDFDGPIVLIPEEVESWLKSKLPSTIDRSRMRRREQQDIPFELIREAVVNALVHRDYEIQGAKCQLVVTPDIVSVKSPGGPITPITLQQLQGFDAPMLSRNPQLHFVFARMELAEERGLGLQSLRKQPEKLGLPLPKYSFVDPYLELVLYRSAEGAIKTLPADVLEALNKDELSSWRYLASKPSTTMGAFASHMGFTARTAQRHLKRFAELSLIERVGAGPSTKYKVLGGRVAEPSLESGTQGKTRFQKFKSFIDFKIDQSRKIKKGISRKNRKARIKRTGEWRTEVAKGIHTALGPKARDQFTNRVSFTPQLFYGESMGGLEETIDSFTSYLENLKKDTTAPDLLPDFNPEDLRDFE